jgi:D-alanine-D-alanine ligase
MPKKLRVGIIFGGKSAEHTVSIMSARNVVGTLDVKKYEPVLIGISKSGRWVRGDKNSY